MMEAVSGGKAKDGSQGELEGILKGMGYTLEQVFKY
jgi:cytochrome-b5 reductase